MIGTNAAVTKFVSYSDQIVFDYIKISEISTPYKCTSQGENSMGRMYEELNAHLKHTKWPHAHFIMEEFNAKVEKGACQDGEVGKERGL